MKLTVEIKKHTLRKIFIALLACSVFVCIYHTYNHRVINYPTQPTQISADSNIYQEARRNDLHYLHKVGNKDAKQANYEYALTVAGRKGYVPDNETGLRSEPSLSQHFLKKHMKYHHDKYGNYWSWFEDHQAIGNDVFDIGHSIGATNASYYKSQSGIMANEAVLRHHGVHSGVNFVYFAR